MGQPRASRRKTVATSSDDDDGDATTQTVANHGEDDVSQKVASLRPGKLRSVKSASQPDRSGEETSTARVSPAKSSRKGKSRSSSNLHPAAAEEVKRTTRPIFSFFNAATQAQRGSQLSQPSASPEKSQHSQHETEVIQDDSNDDQAGSVPISEGSSTALALRKRKVYLSQSNDEEAKLAPSATQKFRKTSDGRRTPSLPVINEDKRPWSVQFAPTDLSELAVHKRKVSDVRQWLESVLRGKRQKVMVLKGAAGTGKTTTIQLLAKDMHLDIIEWKNPAGNDYAAESSLSAAAQFEDFISRAGKVSGLTLAGGDGLEGPLTTSKAGDDTSGSSKQILLIEEFPNTFSRTSIILQSFRSAILQYLSSPPVQEATPLPIVMVLSETLLSTGTAAADSFTAHRLLGPELLSHPFLDVVEFNAVAPTILTKALETIVLKEARKTGRRKTPGSQIIKHLASSGDIRSAVSGLEFLCLRGDDGDNWSSKVTFTRPKKAKSEPGLTNAEQEALKLICNRESTLGIFHSVGKVVYNKRVEPPPGTAVAHPPSHLPQHRRTKAPENDVDELMDDIGTDVSTFLAALHENYALSCFCSTGEETTESLSNCIDNLSDGDLLSLDRFSSGTQAFSGSSTDSLRQDEMSYQVAARGLLFSMPYPVHRATPPSGNKADAHKMYYPASIKLWRAREEVEGMLDLLTTRAQSGTLQVESRTASRLSGTAGGGVESWAKRSGAAGRPAATEAPSSSESSNMPTPTAKVEMLIDRLPYMALLMASKSSSLLDQIQRVTRVRGLAATTDDGNVDIEDDDRPDEANAVEQWATDRPDADGSEQPRVRKPQSRGKAKLKTEGGGLHIPVESQVDRLVLEDDDIEDD